MTERAPSPLAFDAGSISALPAGARVRYVVRGDWRGIRAGRVARASADTMWLESGRTLVVAQLRRLDVSRGGGSSESKRLGWGAMAGAAAVGILGAIGTADSANRQGPSSREGRAALGAAMGAVMGGMAGLLLWPAEQWEPVGHHE